MLFKNKDDKSTQTKRVKALAVEIPSYEVGPKGTPIIFNCRDEPATIHGRVIFYTSYPCKGGNINVEYSAVAESRGNRDVTFSNQITLDRKTFKLELPHSLTPENQQSSSDPGGPLTPSDPSSILPDATETQEPTSAHSGWFQRKGTGVNKKQRSLIKPGTYTLAFSIKLDPTFPSSCATVHGSIAYTVRATLHRAFPSLNVVQTQLIWVLNSQLLNPADEHPVYYPERWQQYYGLFENRIPYRCVLPPNLMHPGQELPVLVELDPPLDYIPTKEEAEQMTRESNWQRNHRERAMKRNPFLVSRNTKPSDIQPGDSIRVLSLEVKLKEYTWHTSKSGHSKFTKRQILQHNVKNKEGKNINASGDVVVIDEGGRVEDDRDIYKGSVPGNDKENLEKYVAPYPHAGQSWRKVFVIKLPGIWKMNTNTRTDCIRIQHNLKLIMKVKVGKHLAKEIRIEMPIVISAPRPPGEPVASFDRDRYLAQLSEAFLE
ncbi:hypothetical protein BGZ80_001698 [Entomortierella chlamydospora]|uniref:Arrestin domain-containing protein n=1 Tax=Entomortierella chlamydospora TaxID=101097 RepID=A0A9P6SXT5_9FUNG|nr:hypothetical protein BGZ80_001698 [Entomortierella chlamydospora]